MILKSFYSLSVKITQLTFRGYSIKFRLPQFGEACSDKFLLGHQEKSYVQTGAREPGN